MEMNEVLRSRRSIRKYRGDPVPGTDLEEILNAAVCAPSAMNLQHWYLVAVTDPERMEELREVMSRVARKFYPVLEDRFQNSPEAVSETDLFLRNLGGAPACILAFFRKNDFPDRDGAMQSVSAALENLMLAAWEKGLGTCWVSAPQRMGFGPEIQKRFAPGKGEFVAAVTLGYPAESPEMPKRRDGRVLIL